MEKRLWFELKRKTIHILALLFLMIYVVFEKLFDHYAGLLALFIVLILFLVMEYFRVKRKIKIPFFHRFWREGEADKIGGQVYFIIGTIIALAVFDFRIAVAVLFMTTFGDMSAALIGIRFGKRRFFGMKDRMWEGVLAEFAVDLVIGFILLSNVYVIVAMALTATLVETVFTHVDDNLSIPIFAGFVGQILSMIL